MTLRNKIIRLAYEKPELRERLLPLVTASTGIDLLEFVRLTSVSEVKELFLLERGGIYYAVNLEKGSALSYGILASGTKTTAKHAFELEKENALNSVSLFSLPYEVVETKPDDDARKALSGFNHPKWGLDWETPVELKSDSQFLELLRKQLRKWKGTPNSLGISKHREWADFHRNMVDQVKKKYGNRIKLYRGVTGRQAEAARNGDPIPLKTYSSWAVTKGGAKPYSKPNGVILEAVFSPKEIALAPVELPNFEDPEILLRELLYDVQHVGDELVVHHPRNTLAGYKVL